MSQSFCGTKKNHGLKKNTAADLANAVLYPDIAVAAN